MKTMKKLFVGIFSVALFATLFAAPAYAESGNYVFDEYGVLNSSQFDELEEQGASYAQEYGIGVYFAFVDVMNTNSYSSGAQRNEYARQFFLQHGLGVGPNKNGILAVVAVDSRDYVTIKHFDDSSEDPFSDQCVDALESEYTSYLSKNEWYDGAKSYYDVVGEQMEYFAITGKQWTKPDPISLLLKILATLGIPAAVAFGAVNGEKSAMKTARERSEASNYLDSGSLKFKVSQDNYINSTMAVVPIPKKSGSGGGGWSNMGGGFSGSGGGKF